MIISKKGLGVVEGREAPIAPGPIVAVRGTVHLGEDYVYSSFIHKRSSIGDSSFFIGVSVVGVRRDWGAAAAAREAARLGRNELPASKGVRGGGLLGGLLRHDYGVR